MSTDEDLLRAIAANPDDDALRLVYADWLEEQGDLARARYVRVEVAVAQQGGPNHCPSSLWRESTSLWQQHARQWDAELPAWARDKPEWDRGVIRRVNVTARNFLRHGNRLGQYLPGVRTIGITRDQDQWPALVAHPALSRLRGVHAEGAEAWRHLSGMTLPLLEELHLNFLHDTPTHVQWGAEQAERWPQLHSIWLQYADLLLPNLALMPLLRSLRLAWYGEEPTTGGELPPNLENLELITPQEWTPEVLHSVNCAKLIRLRLIHSTGDPTDLTPLNRNWSRLETLEISNSGISVNDLIPLFKADRFPALRELNLHCLPCTEADFVRLVDTPAFGRLRRLSIIFVMDVEAGLERWLSSSRCEHLESLNFSFPQPCETLARAMCESPYLGRLHRLRILPSPLGGDAMAILRNRFDIDETYPSLDLWGDAMALLRNRFDVDD